MSAVPFVTGRTDTRAEIPARFAGIRLTFGCLTQNTTDRKKAELPDVSGVKVDSLRLYQASGNVLQSVVGAASLVAPLAFYENRSLCRLKHPSAGGEFLLRWMMPLVSGDCCTVDSETRF